MAQDLYNQFVTVPHISAGFVPSSGAPDRSAAPRPPAPPGSPLALPEASTPPAPPDDENAVSAE